MYISPPFLRRIMDPADDCPGKTPVDDMIDILSKMHEVVEEVMKENHEPDDVALLKDLVTLTVLMDYIYGDAYAIDDYLRGCGVEETGRLRDFIREMIGDRGDRNETVAKANAVIERMDAFLEGKRCWRTDCPPLYIVN